MQGAKSKRGARGVGLIRTTILVVLALLTVVAASVPTQAANPLSEADLKAYRAAFSAVRAGKWSAALSRIERAEDQHAAKAVRWMWYTTPGSNPRFEEVISFIEENPHWPDQDELRRRAEDVLGDGTPRARVLQWFDANPPLTGRGMHRYAEALMAAGRKDEVRPLVRRAWVDYDMPRRIEVGFRKRFRKMLTYQDHLDRLDRLIWQGRLNAAMRQARRVKQDDRYLAEARIALRRFRGGVDPAIARVPQRLLMTQGLIYERLRWRRRKGFDARAAELLVHLPETLQEERLWWRERSILARRALNDGDAALAYKLAADHKQTAGFGFAQAEWMSGWIALRYLDVPDVALDHFMKMYRGVQYPVSKARGAYWAARALSQVGRDAQAREWYARAAQHVTTFYGQTAALHLPLDDRPRLPVEPEPDEATQAAFNKREIPTAVRHMHAAGAEELMDKFLKHLARTAESGPDWVLSARLAKEVGRNDEAVKIAKAALRDGHVLGTSGYPWLALGEDDEPEHALVLAVVRQESAFDTRARSSAGALGLMQVMPATARLVARKINVRYSRDKLTGDPDYNLKIGRAYLADLLESYDGSLPLALAAYNAGPYRINKWVKKYGDPRKSLDHAIDWIETIPIYETRNYVQRVMENLTVYRQRISGRHVSLSLTAQRGAPTSLNGLCDVTC